MRHDSRRGNATACPLPYRVSEIRAENGEKKIDKCRDFVLILTIVGDCAQTQKNLRQNVLKSQISSAFFVRFATQRFSAINTR